VKNIVGKSWQTSVAGIVLGTGGVLAALTAYFDGDPATVVNWQALVACVVAGLGLGASRDNKVSSEDVAVGS